MESEYGQKTLAECGSPPLNWHHLPGQAYSSHRAFARCVKDWIKRKWTWKDMGGMIHLALPVVQMTELLIKFGLKSLPKILRIFRTLCKPRTFVNHFVT
ncbi:hypothetical protein Pmani_036225 [Petrolisthes manimaculis]|uniref:Uncharacterized protein n=1 Tax=Petrolisthes manimaculis TaxID=1843537 RepID=A0AAE1TMM5_9EUCA|nr:hypothetical protein Pmani_036225 [Petrolisthes manimaculis]